MSHTTWSASRRRFWQRRKARNAIGRTLFAEHLEARELLAADWQNPFIARDVNRDGVVVPLDALLPINELNARTLIDENGVLPSRAAHPNEPFFDIDGDGFLVAFDVLTVINGLNNDVTPPTFAVGLVRDSAPRGGTNTDLLTNDARLSGKLTDELGVGFLQAIVDGGTPRTLPIRFDGTFDFDPRPLADGEHRLRLSASDGKQNAGTSDEFVFQLDTLAPGAPTNFAIDSASDRGPSNSDGITNDNTPTIRGDAAAGSTIVVSASGTVVGTGTANSPWDVTTSVLVDGRSELTAVAEDAAGNASAATNVLPITIDTVAPAAQSNLSGTLNRTFSVFDVSYSVDIAPAAFDPATYGLRVVGGANDGQLIGIGSVSQFPNAQAFVDVGGNLPDQGYRLSVNPALTDLAGNPLTGTNTFSFALADPPGIAELAPGNGATQVGLTRETVVRFDEPVDPATITADAFHLIAKGERIPGRIVTSPTERFATIFYNTALPESTEVRVVVDGNRIMGRDGRLLDADGDDQPGGMKTADFSTLALTRIPGTELFGYVYDAANRIAQESLPIPVPTGDPQFDPASTGTKTIPFKRAEVIPGTGTSVANPRLFVNKVTSFIDASMVYGSDESRARALRAFDGSGRLKTSSGNLLPINNAETFPTGTLMNRNEGPFPSNTLPVAGDMRAAEVPTLTAMHTLWVREHNRFAAEVKAANPRWSDDQIYEAARQWVGGLIQHISYQEFLPAIVGPTPLSAYAGYQPAVDPSISPLFSTAAFRIGHTLQSGSIQRLDASGQSLPGGPLIIRNAFFNPNPLRDDGLDAYLRGMAAGSSQEFDLKIIDDLRNFLFGPPGAGGLDLASINIQRGRDMGLPGYNQARVDRGLPRVTSFAQITSNATAATAMQAIYGDVDKVDLWIGGLAEDRVAGGVVGPLFAKIFQDQFQRSRDGDRFWYENAQFSDADLTALRGTRLSDVIMRNSGVTGLPANVFTTMTANTGPGAGGSSGAPTEPRSFDGYGNNETNEHLGEANWPLRVDYTVSFGDGISTPAGADRPNPRAISNALVAQSGNTVNSAGLTDLAITWGQFLDHDMDLTPPQSVAGTNIPVQGATIRVDAFPSANVVTDAQGFFELEDMPAPEFFVHIDGTTATNAPAGMSYPSVGKPFHTIPGRREQLSMAGMPFNVYLPPMATADIQPLSATENTNVGFGDAGMDELERMFPTINATEWSKVKVTFAPGAAINEQGTAATQAVVIPVPPDRLPAPLPPGVDPKLVISIQASGATNLNVPAAITYPNLDNLPLGEHATLFSFDHDIGAFVPVGTLEVVSDGAGGTILVSDPGVGIVAPGWHYITDPLNWLGSRLRALGNLLTPEPVPVIIPTLDSTVGGREIKLEFLPPSGTKKKVGAHDPPPIEPSRDVTITVEGPFADYYKIKDGGGVRTLPTFTLRAGDPKRTMVSVQKTLAELKTDLNGGKLFEENILYGSKITVREVLTLSDGTKQKSIRIFFPYMLIDGTDPEKEDLKLKFARVIADGAAKEFRAVPFILKTGPSQAGLELSDPAHYFHAPGVQQLWFDPTEARAAAWTTKLQVKEPIKGALAGEIELTGIAVKKQGYKVDTVTFENVAAQVGNDDGTAFPNISIGQRALLDNLPPPAPPLLAERDVILSAIKSKSDAFFSDASASAGIFDGASSADNADDIVFVTFKECANPRNLGGAEGNALEPVDTDLAKIVDIYTHRDEYSQFERAYRMAEEINKELAGPIRFCFFNFFNGRPTFDDQNELKFAFGHNNAHEIGHHLGLYHTFGWKNGGTQVAGYDARPRTDVMSQGLFPTDTQDFDITKEALKFGLHIKWVGADADKALAYYNAYQTAGGNFNSISEEDENSGPGLVLFPSPTLGLFSNKVGVIATTLDLGSVVADGPGGATLGDTWTLKNLGPGNLKLTSVTPSANDAVIAVTPNLSGTVLSGTTTATLNLTFDPATPGLFRREITIVADNGEQYTITVTARGLDTQPNFNLALANNNCGGAEVGSTMTCFGDLQITNLGVQELTFTPQVVSGQVDFSLNAFQGVVQRLASEAMLSIPVEFSPSALGLRPGMLQFTTNDPDRPLVNQGIVGTGVPVGGIGQNDFDWGRDFVRVRGGGVTHQLRSDDSGFFQVGLGTIVEYDISIFDPISGYLAKGGGTSGPSGAFNDITTPLRFAADTSPDSDFDGLPDNTEAAIGSFTNRKDSDGDGLSDFFEIQQGLDPLGNVRVPTGVIANLEMPGEVSALAVGGDLIFVATGSHGMAIIDGSKFDNPIILGQLPLVGGATAIGVDTKLNIAAVATGQGLALVNIADPMLPRLIRTVPINPQRVLVHDGVAYAAVGGDISVVDLNTGEVLQTLDPLTGFGGITGLARDGSHLYAYDRNAGTFLAIDISVHDDIRVVGRTTVSVASSDVGLHAGNGVAWLAGSGLRSIDINDPTRPSLIGSPTGGGFFDARRIALNGSGLGVLAPDFANKVEIFDVSVPTVTDNKALEFPLTGRAGDVAISRGLAYVGNGNRLAVVNYLPFDNLGAPPTVMISSPAVDEVPGQPGVQIFEGTTIPVRVDVTDDVQVRAVELVVDGRTVETDVSFPFDFSVPAPKLIDDGATPIVVRAIDTGGNVATSTPLNIQVVDDTFPPTVTLVSPAENSIRGELFRTVRVTFSERMDPATLIADNLRLSLVATPNVFVAPTNLQTRDRGRTVQFTYDRIPPGENQLVLRASALRDIGGNPLGATDIVHRFTVLDATALWINPAGGNWDDPANWEGNQLPGADDHVLINVPGNVTITHRSLSSNTRIKSLTSANKLTLTGGTLDVETFVEVRNTFTLQGGTLANATLTRRADLPSVVVADFANVTLDHVTLNNNLKIGNAADVAVQDGLVLNGTLSLISGNNVTDLNIVGTQTISGTGRIELSGTSGRSRITTNVGETLTIGAGITIQANSGSKIGVAGALVNDGTIIGNSAGQTTNVDGSRVDNRGTIDVRAGTLSVANPANFVGGTLTGGVWRAGPGATLDLFGANVVTNQAQITIDGATARFLRGAGAGVPALGGLRTLGATGRLSLLAGHVLSTDGGLTNDGALTIGTGSQLQVAGTFAQSDAASLTIGIGGISQIGSVAATGAATLDGDLNLDIAPGTQLQLTTLTPLTFASRTGVFDAINNAPAGTPFLAEHRVARVLLHFGATLAETATLPFAATFNTGTLGEDALTRTNAVGRVAVVSTNGPRTGGRHLALDASAAGFATNEYIVPLSIDSVMPIQLGFYHKSFDTTADPLPATFVGSIGCDGVAISTDGVTWHRVVDLSTATSANYEPFTFDLRAIATAAGLTLTDRLLVKFQQVGGYLASSTDGRAFDDIRIGADVVGPRVTSVTPSSPLIFASDLSQFVAVFSESLSTASATDAANYTLVGAGTDGLFGTIDDVRVSLAPPIFDGTTSVTLRTLNNTPLSPGAYQLTFKGQSTITDAAGVPLLDGLDHVNAFSVFGVESPTNETRPTATETGITADGGTFALRAAIGNSPAGGSDIDLYRFVAGANQFVRANAIKIAVAGVTAPLDLRARLLDANGAELATANAASSDDAVLGFRTVDVGTYFVEVTSVPTNAGLYQFTLSSGGSVAEFPLTENFEIGPPLAAFWESSSTTTGRIRVTDSFPAIGGHFQLLTDTNTPVDPWLLVHQNSAGANRALSDIGLIENVDYTVVTAGEFAALTTAQIAAFDVVFVTGSPAADFGLLHDENNDTQSDLNTALAGAGTTGRAVLATLDADATTTNGQEREFLRNSLNWLRAGQSTGLLALSDSQFDWAWTPWFASLDNHVFDVTDNDVSITQSAHEIMTGLTSAGLSNWSPSSRQFVDIDIPGFTTLAVDTSAVTRRLVFAMDGATETIPPEDRRPALHEAILHVNLAGQANAELLFDAEILDDNDLITELPPTFSGSFNGTGVVLSVDGTNWFNVFPQEPFANLVRFHDEGLAVDLDEFATSKGLTLGVDVRIKFQHFGFGPAPFRGVALDNIQLKADRVGPEVAFVNPLNFAPHTRPVRVATGDVNGDSVPDIIVGNHGFGGAISVFLNTGGAPTAVNHLPHRKAYDVKLADMDGDTDLDIVAIVSDSQSDDARLAILLNTGSGIFGAPTEIPIMRGAIDLALGDLNGDSRPDIVVANGGNRGNGTATILLSAGGGFLTPIPINMPVLPTAIALADLDGDLDLDLAAVGQELSGTTFAIAVFKQEAGGGPVGFMLAGTVGVGNGAADLALGDLNGDSRLDAATSGSQFGEAGRVSVRLGVPGGLFGGGADFLVDAETHSLALARMNADAHLDIVVITRDANGASAATVMVNNGTGVFPAIQKFPTAADSRTVAIADINGDLKNDAVTASGIDPSFFSSEVGNLAILLGGGDGSLAPGQPLIRDAVEFPQGFTKLVDLQIGFNEVGGMNESTMTDVANYRLVEAGPDGQFDPPNDPTPDDRVVTLLTPVVIDGGHGRNSVRVPIAAANLPLAAGKYRLTIKGTATIRDAEGNPLNDFDGDGVGADHVENFVILENGPVIESRFPSLDAGLEISALTLVFSEPIDAGTFTVDDVTNFRMGLTTIVPTSVSVSGRTATIHFPTQTALGFYLLNIGPDIRDLAGNAMNSNFNATFGQTPADVVQAFFEVSLSHFDEDGFVYDWKASDATIEDGGRRTPTESESRFDAYNTGYLLTVGGATYSSLSGNPVLEDAKRTLVFPDKTLAGLTVHREVYVPTTGGNFARLLDVLNNPTGAAVTTTVKLSGGLGGFSPLGVTTTSSGDAILTTADKWFASDDGGDQAFAPELAHVMHDGLGLVAPSAATLDVPQRSFEWQFQVTVNPGQTVRLLSFAVQTDGRAAAATEAASLATLPARATANLSVGELASIINFSVGSPLRLAGGSDEGDRWDESHGSNTALHALRDAAVVLWIAAGLSDRDAATLRAAHLEFSDLPGDRLGVAFVDRNVILVDRDAAGRGWFVDESPEDDREFSESDSSVIASVDLLSVLAHELGHLLGAEHSDDENDAMFDLLRPGQRRTPWSAAVDRLFAEN